MDIVVSSIESLVVSIYLSTVSLYESITQQSDGFKTIIRNSDIGYPANIKKSGEASEELYEKYRPYLNKREDSSRLQHDNHKWPITNEMNGAFEKVLQKDMVLPEGYPSQSNIMKSHNYSKF